MIPREAEPSPPYRTRYEVTHPYIESRCRGQVGDANTRHRAELDEPRSTHQDARDAPESPRTALLREYDAQHGDAEDASSLLGGEVPGLVPHATMVPQFVDVVLK